MFMLPTAQVGLCYTGRPVYHRAQQGIHRLSNTDCLGQLHGVSCCSGRSGHLHCLAGVGICIKTDMACPEVLSLQMPGLRVCLLRHICANALMSLDTKTAIKSPRVWLYMLRGPYNLAVVHHVSIQCHAIMSLSMSMSMSMMTRGIFCDSAHIRPVVATAETPMAGATPNPPGISSGLQREAPPRMSRRGYGTMFRSESFPSCQGCSLCIVPAPDSGCRRVCVCPMASGCRLPPR